MKIQIRYAMIPICIWFCLHIFGCNRKPDFEKKIIPNIRANKDLSQHSQIFKRGVVKVKGADNVYCAIGFGLANSIMVEGKDGIIIVDTMESCQEAETVLAEFRKITQKPIKAIVYTHNHPDHILGAAVFADDKYNDTMPDIYAHRTLVDHVRHLLSKMRPSIGRRSMRMFGTYLDQKGIVNDGIGPFLGIGPDSTTGFIEPNKTFDEKLDAAIAGIDLTFIHAPGETDDQIVVWLNKQKVLLSGDNFYWTFPNLYTIRGTTFRSLKKWYQSIDTMRDLNPRVMVPSHTRPVTGEKKISEILINYRDAIQFVHDQSVRGMNMGMTPDELAQYVILPEHLKKLPYLQEFYGKVSWSARSMFAGNLGWFDGDSADLNPLTRMEKARLMARLAGGEDKLLDFTQKALENAEFQTALELTGYLARLNPDSQAAKAIRVKALIALGEKASNPNARHYYLTEALEIRDNFIVSETVKPTPEVLKTYPLDVFFDLIQVNLNPEMAMDLDQKVGMIFPDVNQAFSIHVRRGIAEIRPCPVNQFADMTFDIAVRADSNLFKQMLAQLRSPVTTLPRFEYITGNTLKFAKFLSMFKPRAPKLPYESSHM